MAYYFKRFYICEERQRNMQEHSKLSVFDKAIIFAVNAHKGMVRKLAESPYITHPMEVAAIASTMTSDEHVLAAAVLHDVVEDTDVTLDDIREEFGERVAFLVAGDTEDKLIERSASETWKERKMQTIQHLANCTTEEKIIILSDKLSNIRSLYREWMIKGEVIWLSFNQKDPGQQQWYYNTIAEALSELSEYEAYKEYNRLICQLFQN